MGGREPTTTSERLFASKDIGRRVKRGLACVESALAALNSAAEVFTGEDFPVDWAGVQQNLGAALLRKPA